MTTKCSVFRHNISELQTDKHTRTVRCTCVAPKTGRDNILYVAQVMWSCVQLLITHSYPTYLLHVLDERLLPAPQLVLHLLLLLSRSLDLPLQLRSAMSVVHINAAYILCCIGRLAAYTVGVMP